VEPSFRYRQTRLHHVGWFLGHLGNLLIRVLLPDELDGTGDSDAFFFAFRIVARGEVDRVVKGAYHRGSTFTETCWYAPSVKRVIKHVSTIYYYAASADDPNWELYNYSLVDPLKPAAASATAP
jgi:hypothetical protein